MKKYLFIVLLVGVWSCEDKKVEDTTPPLVEILSPQNSSIVYEIVNITCISSDNKAVEKVELWVNGVTSKIIDETEPYSLAWNTTLIEDGYYTITIRSYDTSNNVTDSDSILLIVDNTTPPKAINIFPVKYRDGYYISWSVNEDADFSSYRLFESLSENMIDKNLIYETNDRTDTTFSIELNSLKYYQAIVADFSGLETYSNIEIGDYFVKWLGMSFSVLDTDTINCRPFPVVQGELLDCESDSISSEISKLKNLKYLNGGNLYGSISPEIGDLKNLTHLNIESGDYFIDPNNLTGSIPPEIGNLESLEHLSLAGNDLTGSIPPEIGNLESLEHLSLAGNDLTGSIPLEIGNLESLKHLNLDGNNLTGSIPSEIGLLYNLVTLRLEGKPWYEFDLADQRLSGQIPEEIGYLSNLESLWLGYNHLDGFIPDKIWDLVNLRALSFGHNNLSGSIDGVQNLPLLLSFYCDVNNFSGYIPEICRGLFHLNSFCPPYPDCLTDNQIGTQDTTACN